MSAGYDHIDVEELKARGIKFGNTPYVLSAAVAEVAVLLCLATARRLHEGRLKIETNNWESYRPQWLMGQDIQGSTVGIVGFGGIGQAIAKRLIPFEVKQIIYSGHSPKPQAKEFGAVFVSFDELLRHSDFVIIVCPLNEETKGMFNEEAFNKMKPNAILVNVARGGIVDQPALYEALKQGKIFGAGLDVMIPEPLPTDSPLLSLPNCVLLPHVGSATVKTRTAMAVLAAENIIAALEGKPMPAPV
ncbi:glyoxylate reductase/hydroxypyruvate reductase-like isoform X2 [Zootermopsis nevadensis]|nr:glyoxylate reductase/hydroxypyruvate reductase-like isoform X2 [Zootermopsis nevadensis]